MNAEFDQWLATHPECLEARLIRRLADFPAGIGLVDLMHEAGYDSTINSHNREYGKAYVTMRGLAEEGYIRWGEYGETISGRTLWYPIAYDVPDSREPEEVERWLMS